MWLDKLDLLEEEETRLEKLNFAIEERSMFIYPENSEMNRNYLDSPCNYDYLDTKNLPEQNLLTSPTKAIYEQKTRNLISVVKRDYKVITHKEVLTKFLSILQEQNTLFFIKDVHLNSSKSSMNTIVIFPDLELGEVENKTCCLYLNIGNSLDYSQSLKYTSGIAIKQKYTNGTMSFHPFSSTLPFQKHLKHTKNNSTHKLFLDLSSISAEVSKSVLQKYLGWKDIPMPVSMVKTLLAKVDFPKKRIKLIQAEVSKTYQEELSIWDLLFTTVVSVNKEIESGKLSYTTGFNLVKKIETQFSKEKNVLHLLAIL